jgi:hypothetical protein
VKALRPAFNSDVLKRVEDFDYPYQFILRSGRAVIIPALFGTHLLARSAVTEA